MQEFAFLRLAVSLKYGSIHRIGVGVQRQLHG